ncbi:MAG: hypothetical protein SFW67_20855 [Myxococcaceae bacterium]|nr:hypothetical protein [Myxococcaceae bacterium]
MRRLTPVALAVLSGAAWADDTLVTFTTSQTTAPLPFVEYLPPGYATGTQPERLVIFFHGVGESGGGSDQASVFNAMTAHGPLQQIRSAGTGSHRFKTTHRAVVLAPRNPSGLWNASLASSFFAWARARYRVDADRIYLTGLSAGGGPTWTVPKDQPGAVAAIVPICPVQQLWPVMSTDAHEHRSVAVWAFHGFGDPTVPREESIRWMNAIGQSVSRDPGFASVMSSYPFINGQFWLSAGSDQTAAWTATGYVWRTGVGTNVASPWRYTLLDRNDHFVWGAVYSNDDVWNWLFAQRRSLNIDPGLDGGVTRPDAGAPSMDAGVQAPDAGSPPLDAGLPTPDAGIAPVDAGAPAVDAGAPALDAGTPTVDAGVEPDAGEPSVDAGLTPDAGLEPDGGDAEDAGRPLDGGAMMADGGATPADAGPTGMGPGERDLSDAIGGCGCAATNPLVALLALVGLRLRRRQRAG